MQGGNNNEGSGGVGHRVRGGEVICRKGATPRLELLPLSLPFHCSAPQSDLPDRFTGVKGKETEGGEKGGISDL